MERRGIVDLPQVAVLCEESTEFGIEVAGLGVVELGLGVVVVARKREAVLGVVQLGWKAEVAPGILGNLRPLPPSARHTTICSRGAGLAGAAHPLGFQRAPVFSGDGGFHLFTMPRRGRIEELFRQLQKADGIAEGSLVRSDLVEGIEDSLEEDSLCSLLLPPDQAEGTTLLDPSLTDL